MTRLMQVATDAATVARLRAATGIEPVHHDGHVLLRCGDTQYVARLEQLGRLPGEPRPAQHDEPQAA